MFLRLCMHSHWLDGGYSHPRVIRWKHSFLLHFFSLILSLGGSFRSLLEAQPAILRSVKV